MAKAKEPAPLKPADHFGKLLVDRLRDKPRDDFKLVLQKHWKSPSVQKLQDDLAALTPAQQSLVERAVAHVVDSAVHDFLVGLQEESDLVERVKITVDGKDLFADLLPDGFQYELFGPEGWYGRFSKYGPERDED